MFKELEQSIKKTNDIEQRNLNTLFMEKLFFNNEKTKEKQPEPKAINKKDSKSQYQEVHYDQDSLSEGNERQNSNSSQDDDSDNSSPSTTQDKPTNHKTVLCKWYEKYGKCNYEGWCNFAHGQKELIFLRQQNAKVSSTNLKKPNDY